MGETKNPTMGLPTRVLLVFVGTVVYLGLAVLGWGGFRAFFSHPALIALTVVFLVQAVAAFFAGGNLSPGAREDRSNRWVIAALTVNGLLNGFLAASRIGRIWVIDGDTIRWAGVVFAAVGGTLRLWPVFVLAVRFERVRGDPGRAHFGYGQIYSVIRNPSYLGLLVGSLGWSLSFRAGVGVVLTAILIPPLVARIRSEEKLLQEQFGGEYEAYCARTFRLIPWIYSGDRANVDRCWSRGRLHIFRLTHFHRYVLIDVRT